MPLQIINLCLTAGIYPKSWSSVCVVPIHKASDASDPNDYCGITITAALGILLNKILDNRLQKFLEIHRVKSDGQIGLKKKASTSDHMFILKTSISIIIQMKVDCTPALLIFKRPFILLFIKA